MAKDSKDTGSKSEAIPGGTKASDLPASVGGTSGASRSAADTSSGATPSPSTPSGQPAPVTTDAASHTPSRTAGESVPVRDVKPDDALAPSPGEFREGTLRGRSFGPVREDEHFGPPPGMRATSSAAEGVSVGDMAGSVREFITRVRSHDWAGAWKAGAAVVHVFGDLMDSGAFSPLQISRVASSSEVAPETRKRDTGRITSELASVRNELSGSLASGRRASWHGGEPHPHSGSPMPAGSPSQAERHTTIDPQGLFVLYELVQKCRQHFAESSQAQGQ